MKVILANPRGFCAGVDRAIDIVERALELFGSPIYVRHEVVHNRFVVNNLRDRGAIFVDDLHQIPDQATVIFSAHGVSQKVIKEAENRGLRVFDATCPLVTKVHLEVARYAQQGYEVILIGHRGHPEVEGTMGQYIKANDSEGNIHLIEQKTDVQTLNIKNKDKLAFVTQTTLSVDDTMNIIAALKQRFPKICGPKKDDICYATQNRQDAVKDLVTTCDVILVVGSPNSSNSNRLKEIAIKHNIATYLIDGAEDVRQHWFDGKVLVGITAGASAPEVLVEAVLEKLKSWGATVSESNIQKQENVIFPLPKILKKADIPGKK